MSVIEVTLAVTQDKFPRPIRTAKAALNGENNYRLLVPANVPARELWEVTMYTFFHSLRS